MVLILFLFVMMKQVKGYGTMGTPKFFYNRPFSVLPAPVPRYFDGVTLNR